MQGVPGGERALRGIDSSWGLATGFGHIDDDLGLRLGWQYTNTNMQFKDYSGSGSERWTSHDLGKLKATSPRWTSCTALVGSRSLISMQPAPALPACGRRSVPRIRC